MPSGEFLGRTHFRLLGVLMVVPRANKTRSCLITWPCLVYKSFGGFCAATFIIGNGLGSLETAANPYITICGPPRYAEIRINISQAFNGIGTST